MDATPDTARPRGGDRRSSRHRRCVVTAVERVTPRMARVSIRSDDLVGVDPAGPDQRVKLLFPEGRTFTGDPAEVSRQRRRRRTYTLINLDPQAGTADIDFVLHGTGVASQWAAGVQPGDELELAGPMGRFDVDPAVTRYLLVTDETGLPALEQILAALPDGALAEAHVEVADDAERRDLPVRDGVDVTWWPRAGAGADGGDAEPGALMDALTAHLRMRGDEPGQAAAAWIVGEAAPVATLRAHVQAELGFERRRVTAVAYWRRGADGEA